MAKLVSILALLFSTLAFAFADTPAHCLYEDIRGAWLFQETERSGDNTIRCDQPGPIVHQFEVFLDYPNVASDKLGHKGTWTLIYNQGFEVIINSRKYFAFSYYEDNGGTVTSYCDRISPGSSHDVLTNNWACYNATKVGSTRNIRTRTIHEHGDRSQMYKKNLELINRINAVQKSWTARHYEKFESMTVEELNRMFGTGKPRQSTPDQRRRLPSREEIRAEALMLPESFDWQNVNNQNFVSPVRDQRSCGSCYAFAAMALLEARLQLATNNTVKKDFSPQDILGCSYYAQGCLGGFDYLIAGKYAEDFGVVEESCFPYLARDSACNTDTTCRRHYISKYEYIGGYDGASTEELMRIALIENGPIAVSFEVYDDFGSYGGGIYHYTGQRDEFNPFEIVNHNVLVVGYGVDSNTGEKFWNVKNSWGQDWGEEGYFRIRRATDECSIESLAFEAFPIIP